MRDERSRPRSPRRNSTRVAARLPHAPRRTAPRNTSSIRTTPYAAGSRCSAIPTKSARSSRADGPHRLRTIDRWARTRRSRRVQATTMLYDYFTQMFAQVTKQPLDSIPGRDLNSRRPDPAGAEHARAGPGERSQDRAQPPKTTVIDNEDMAKIRHRRGRGHAGQGRPRVRPVPVALGERMRAPLTEICRTCPRRSQTA